MNVDTDHLIQHLRQFAHDRDWEQFHSPKNLACALTVGAGELLEHFQWMSDEQSRALSLEKRSEIGAEIADVFLYLVQLADKLDIDLSNAVDRKLAINELKYPVALARGTSKKYDKL